MACSRSAPACPPLCRFSDAGMTRLSTRCGGRRPKSAKARSRGKYGTRQCSECYGDRMLVAISMVDAAPARGDVHARMHVSPGECNGHHRDRHQHTIPIALAALPGAILPATSCLVQVFRCRPDEAIHAVRRPASENLHTTGHASSLQVIEQCLRLLESRRVEAFSEPAVCGLEEVAGVVALALVEPEIS